MVGYRDPTPGAQIVPPLLGIAVPRTGDFLAAVGDARSRELLDRFVAAARPAVPELPLVPYRTRLRGWLLPLTRLSDNASFWDAGYASLMLTDTAFLRNPPSCIGIRRPSTTSSSGRPKRNRRATAPARSRRTDSSRRWGPGRSGRPMPPPRGPPSSA